MARPSVLVVEDDSDIRSALVSILEEEGYQVESAGNGAEALRALRGGSRPFAILLDLMMPVMDGRQFRQAQLLDPELAAIPVIVLTAEPGGRQTGRACGAVATFAKPFEVGALLAELDWLERVRAPTSQAPAYRAARDAVPIVR